MDNNDPLGGESDNSDLIEEGELSSVTEEDIASASDEYDGEESTDEELVGLEEKPNTPHQGIRG